jgi:nucleotide-binding universal stress UspA family protein
MKTPRVLLVPIDFSEPSTAALDCAVDLAEGTGARIYVLHTFEVPLIGLPDGVIAATAEVTSRILGAAQKGLDDAIARYDGRKVVMTPLLKRGNTRAVILEMAEDLCADLICIGTHGRRGIARALIGSVAEAVVRTSPVPVLTVHAPASAA